MTISPHHPPRRYRLWVVVSTMGGKGLPVPPIHLHLPRRNSPKLIEALHYHDRTTASVSGRVCNHRPPDRKERFPVPAHLLRESRKARLSVERAAGNAGEPSIPKVFSFEDANHT